MKEVKEDVKNVTKEKSKKITLRTLLVLIAVAIFAAFIVVTVRAEYLNLKGIGTE